MNDVFSNWCRRAILYYLKDHDGPASLTAVTRQIITWHREFAEHSEREAAAVERTRSWLLYAHVLKMEDIGVLEYRPGTDTVWIPEDVTVSVTPPVES